MKKIIFVFLFSALSVLVFAQSNNSGLIQSSQFPVNTYMINPAYAGAEEYTAIQASFKKYYGNGLTDAPQTMYLSAHTRLQKAKKITVEKYVRVDTIYPLTNTLPVRGRTAAKYTDLVTKTIDSLKARDKADREDYKKRVIEAKNKVLFRPYHGIGGNIINESYGINSRTGLGFTYAYHLYLSKTIRWSLGATLTAATNGVNSPEYKASGDAAAIQPASGKINLDFNLGTYIYTDKFHLGISAFNILSPAPFKVIDGSKNNLQPIVLGNVGYRINLSEDLSVTPALLFRYFVAGGLPLSFDVNARVNYKSIWAGVTYRNQSNIAGMVGITISEKFDISYSHDFAINKGTSTFGSEIILGYRLKRKTGGLTSRLFN